MKKPLHQRLLKGVGFGVAGAALFGVLLDAISNAVSIIGPYITYTASAVLITCWLFLELTAAVFGIPWVSRVPPTAETNNTRHQLSRIKRLGPQLRFGLFGVLAILWVPRLGDLHVTERRIPPISVHLVNPSNISIQVARRGEFVLWLPTALYDGAPRVGGRFQFFLQGEAEYSDADLSVPAKGDLWVSARLLGKDRFLPYLEREDTDLSLYTGTSAGTRSSPNVPFSVDALSGRYLEWVLERTTITPGQAAPFE